MQLVLTPSKIIKFIGMIFAFLFIFIWALSGISGISPGEVGILIKNVGDNRGMQKTVLSTGTHWVEPFTYDVVTYDARCRQMQDKPEEMSAGTADGQPVTVDFTVQMCLLPANVPKLHEEMGPTYYDSNIHPAIQSIIKNKIPSEASDTIYTAQGRANVEKAMNDEVKRRFLDVGVNVEVNLRDIKFNNPAYVAILEQKATAQQQVEVNTRKATAAVQEAIRVANEAEGEKQKRIKAAEAKREESKLEGEGNRLQQEETAKGNLAIAKAEAEGTRLKKEALEGAGGDRMVQMEWARNLGPNVKVYAVPTGSPGTTSVMDLNGVLKGAFAGIK